MRVGVEMCWSLPLMPKHPLVLSPAAYTLPSDETIYVERAPPTIRDGFIRATEMLRVGLFTCKSKDGWGWVGVGRCG